jgi:Lrp/AsnC family transcriptional regulator of ectoine degradation
MRLDAIDLKILSALQGDGRMTKLRLAEAAGLSPAACWERLRRLERSGVIEGYAARIDPARVGRFASFVVEVTLKSHRQDDFRRFETAIQREPTVTSCDAVGGGIDYILRIVAADVEQYQALVDRLLEEGIGIDRYFTYVVTKVVKSAPFPVQAIAEGAAREE